MKILLLVLGMGRSGSSLLSGLCNLAGLRIPGPMLPAAPDNPQGFFEPLEVLEANQRYLERMDSSWYDVSLRPLLEPDGEALRLLQVDIDRLFDLHPAPLIVIKEPRMVITAPSWIAAAERRGYRVVFALPLRHPHEVIGSLRARRIESRPLRQPLAQVQPCGRTPNPRQATHGGVL